MVEIITLTQIQQSAVDYALRAKRPNDYRVRRKTGRIVREWCEKQGYTAEQTAACMRDTHDMVALGRLAL
jgi:hypothetical protein